MTTPGATPPPSERGGQGPDRDRKDRQLDAFRADHRGEYLTTNEGVRVQDTDNSLIAGERGPSLMEDFHLREKITHFDHERIPERVVHARGSGAYGYFELYEPLPELTRAAFLTEPGVRTPVFVRFSTVAGFRGSADTVRDVRGFATRFYTTEGNFDLVGNNMPIFFIQDGIKFPDFVHAVKPEPDNETPQASSAHDTLWDFVQLQPETMHMMLWLMSDRALPRSYRMMQGFGVHTFRLVNGQGHGTFVKFHWKPKLGVHSLVWDETQKVAGQDPDFNRRDLWDSIAAGQFPEYELGLQLIPEEDEHAYGFDLLDPTKIVPEEQVPVRPVGRMVLDRNPDNFFAEVEQVAFHIGNLVPGIDVTNDPLLQARLFSYLDTQLIRLGGPNFPQIPVNQPLAPVHNNQRDGYHQMRIDTGRSSYEKNTLGTGCPMVAGTANGGYTHYPERVAGEKIRRRAESFGDHYSQAALFWRSMADFEQQHIVGAFTFELGKVTERSIREGVLAHLARVDADLANRVGQGLGLTPPEVADVPEGNTSPALSQTSLMGDGSLTGRRIAVLTNDGLATVEYQPVKEALERRGAVCEAVAPHAGEITTVDAGQLPVDRSLVTVASTLFDAVLIPGGNLAVDALVTDGDAVHFVNETYKHGKAIGALGAGVGLLHAANLPLELPAEGESGFLVEHGVVSRSSPVPDRLDEFAASFAEAVAVHRHWYRPTLGVPA